MCFGCQVLADALGGRTGKNPDGGFVLQVERLALSPQLASSPALRLAAADSNGTSGGDDSGGGAPMQSLRLLQSHGDAVLSLPPGAVALASSPTAVVECWTNSGGNVLAVQGHAELSREEMLEKIWPAITAAGRLTPAQAEESRRSLADDPHDGMLVRLLFRRFMEGHSLLGVEPAAAAEGAAAEAAGAAAAGAAAADPGA